jgi:hypothetical protein
LEFNKVVHIHLCRGERMNFVQLGYDKQCGMMCTDSWNPNTNVRCPVPKGLASISFRTEQKSNKTLVAITELPFGRFRWGNC